ncbi:MAG: hypothetical protein JW850_04550 [Thermoflexales bacterium]|nr:hypothetical protein [Thermoflexales bacterium]
MSKQVELYVLEDCGVSSLARIVEMWYKHRPEALALTDDEDNADGYLVIAHYGGVILDALNKRERQDCPVYWLDDTMGTIVRWDRVISMDDLANLPQATDIVLQRPSMESYARRESYQVMGGALVYVPGARGRELWGMHTGKEFIR